MAFALNLREKAADDINLARREAPVMVLEKVDIWYRWIRHLHPGAMEICYTSLRRTWWTTTFPSATSAIQQKPAAESSEASEHKSKRSHGAISSHLKPSWTCHAGNPAGVPERVQNHGPRDEVEGSIPPAHQPGAKKAIHRCNIDTAIPYNKCIVRLWAATRVHRRGNPSYLYRHWHQTRVYYHDGTGADWSLGT